MLLFVASIGLMGCSDTTTDTADGQSETNGDSGDGHSEHAHPETFAEALAALVEQQTTIKEAFTSGDMEAAHGPLHEIGHTIDLLPELAEKEGVEGETLEGIKSASKSLFEAFQKLDDVMHGGEEIKYDDVAEEINAALAIVSAKSAGE
jgi:hypothetical protein